MRKPSPALIVACVALFCSLGGVSYGVATGFIDSREIKNNTIRAKDIRNGQVTSADLRDDNVSGADVNESSLGKVPSAASADSAAKATNATNATNAAKAGIAGHAATASNASNADAVGGVRERGIDVRQNAGTPSTNVFSFGGLVINVECQVLGSGGDIGVAVDTTQNNAEATSWGQSNAVAEAGSPSDFDPGELLVLGPALNGSIGDYGKYEIAYTTPSRSVVTVSLGYTETPNALGGTADCFVYGHARQSG
jgi:hypothetical protein